VKRKIIEIDREKCDGCGLCVPNCAEGAIKIVEGKATLVADSYCDGLGACLGHCPKEAIKIIEREAEAFDEKKAIAHNENNENEAHESAFGHTCPGSQIRKLSPRSGATIKTQTRSRLSHWPVKLRLIPQTAPFLKNANLLICADCVPFSIPDFHDRYLEGRAVVVGCPKLDDLDFYSEKLELLFKEAKPAKITVLRMEVPCCGGIAHVAKAARDKISPSTPFEVHIIGINGEIDIVDH